MFFAALSTLGSEDKFEICSWHTTKEFSARFLLREGRQLVRDLISEAAAVCMHVVQNRLPIIKTNKVSETASNKLTRTNQAKSQLRNKWKRLKMETKCCRNDAHVLSVWVEA
jgi:hypothetical protein